MKPATAKSTLTPKLRFREFRGWKEQSGDALFDQINQRNPEPGLPVLAITQEHGAIPRHLIESECITASYIVTYRLSKERMDPAFCNSILNTSLYQAKIRTFAKPSISQANINPTTFKNELIVAIPPTLPEQQRIADCQGSLDALITAETQTLEALKLHKKGLMQQLFPSPEEAEA